jgi:hypothetical protein
MKKLIEALQILLKYGNPAYPTHCEHDVLIICGIEPKNVSQEDIEKLGELGFIISKEYGTESFSSFRYGSA